MRLAAVRHELAHPRTSVQLCLLGIVAGVSAASLIILLRLGVDWLQSGFLTNPNDFASLPPWARFAAPVAGALLIILVAVISGRKHYRMGIPFVIHRVKQHYGHIPLGTTMNQFFGGMLALASGFAVGREGPSVHLGAAGSSFLGQWLRLPYNSIRILAGCGIAAGISASFNTPFAAVIFVMEVVLREYRIHIFIPVMLAAACGSMLTRIAFGEASELVFTQFKGFSQWLYLYLILFGVVMGVLASLFNSQLMNLIRWFRPLKMRWRILLAGVLTGTVGMFLPEAMSANLFSAEVFLADQPGLLLLGSVLVAKVLLALFAISLGIPGGIIGPVFVIGMLSGATLLLPLAPWVDTSQYQGSFALLGMAGLFTAVLHAPLAALSALMELSASTHIILPAMLVIVPAYVTSTQLLGNSSIFIRQLEYQKLSYRTSAVRSTLQKVGVLAAMQSDFKVFYDAKDQHITQFLAQDPTQMVVQRHTFEIGVQYALVQYDVSLSENASALQYQAMEGVSAQATLAEVWSILQAKRQGAVYVYDHEPEQILGVITWNNLRSYLLQEEY